MGIGWRWLEKLEYFREELEERRTEFMEQDDEILDTLVESAEDEEIDKKSEKTNVSRKDRMYDFGHKEAALRPASEKLARSNLSESLNSLSSRNGVKKVVVNLTKFNLRPFSGKIHGWQEFWDGFNSAIHQNENLANVDKLNYLKGYLVDKAKSCDRRHPNNGQLIRYGCRFTEKAI